MPSRDAFSSYHPAVNFLYFGLVLVFTMFFLHPLSLLISLTCGAVYQLQLQGRKALRFQLAFLLPMMGMAALLNPAFNHEGATILAWLPSGNPLTGESVVYGLAAAGMLCAVILWFSCYNAVMTSDKFIYLFGRIIPALSLVLSMALRLVPRFRDQFREVAEVQRCAGRDIGEGGVLRRMKIAVSILSILITWSLENAIETADSMKSRGYGLPGRTAFSIYRFDSRDKAAITWLCGCGLYIACGWRVGGLYWRYFPTVRGVPVTPMTLSFHLAYLALCLTPVILNREEDRKWNALRSKD